MHIMLNHITPGSQTACFASAYTKAIVGDVRGFTHCDALDATHIIRLQKSPVSKAYLGIKHDISNEHQ